MCNIPVGMIQKGVCDVFHLIISFDGFINVLSTIYKQCTSRLYMTCLFLTKSKSIKRLYFLFDVAVVWLLTIKNPQILVET